MTTSARMIMFSILGCDDPPFLVQLPASSFNPIGGIADMTPVVYGISQALEADAAKDSIAVSIVAIPIGTDFSAEIVLRVGWSTPGVAGTIRWGIQYVYLGVGDDPTTAADGEVIVVETVTPPSTSYEFSTFILPRPDTSKRIIKLRLTRYGTIDTNASSVFVEGIVVQFERA